MHLQTADVKLMAICPAGRNDARVSAGYLHPVALAAGATILALAALTAAALPAWRAAQVDPMRTLRLE